MRKVSSMGSEEELTSHWTDHVTSMTGVRIEGGCSNQVCHCETPGNGQNSWGSMKRCSVEMVTGKGLVNGNMNETGGHRQWLSEIHCEEFNGGYLKAWEDMDCQMPMVR